MEIVTDPCITSAEAARRYAEELRLLLLTIGASDAQMEEGQMRVEANVSLRLPGAEKLGTRVEVKNMNSFRSVERAIAFEIERQAATLDAGETLTQETRGWDDNRGETYTMRLKEESEDYRYFPEPDLPPLRTDAALLDSIRAQMPELPQARRARYRDSLGLSAYDAAVIAGSGGAYFDAAMAALPGLDAKRTASLYSKIALRELKTQPDLLGSRDPAQLARVSELAGSGAISSQNAEQVYERHLRIGRAGGRDSRRARPEPDKRLCRSDGRDRARRRSEPVGSCRLPRRQGRGGQIPDRAGYEGDARPGQPRGAQAAARGTATSRLLIRGPIRC